MATNLSRRALPSLFVSHGAPTLALEDSETARFLDNLGNVLPRPSGVLVVSAHKPSPEPELTAGEAPRTWHDFGGFPEALYALHYPAPGNPALAAHAVNLLRDAGFAARSDAVAPFDHGVWVPMLRMYPAADIPVVALSVSPARDAAWHFALGRALAPLRADGTLVIGSGGLVHNLGALAWREPQAAPVHWAEAFAAWMTARVISGEASTACAWRQHAPAALLAHPTPEHLLPLFVAWGAAEGHGSLLHEAWEYATLALHAFRFDGLA